MNNAVLLSIHSEWCEKIASGRKTLEIRKTRPRIEPPFKCYIYCTNGGRLLYKSGYNNEIHFWQIKERETTRDVLAENGNCVFNGKVIGEFTCDKVTKAERGTYCILPASETQMDVIDYVNYADEKPVYGWHISNLVIYDKPKELSEFRGRKLVWRGHNHVYDYEDMKRPPQSWCYVRSR